MSSARERIMTEHTSDRLNRAKRLIADLQKITEDNGATEAEALNAARRLGELLEKYNLDLTDAIVREDAARCVKNEVFAADDFAGTLVVGLKHFCGIIAYREPGAGHAGKYVFFGVPQDVEIALYLYEVCAEAMDNDWQIYMDNFGYSMKKRMSFRSGFASRVYSRLMEMKRERDLRNASKCRDLIVLKDQLVTEEFARQVGIKLVKSSGGRVQGDNHAYLKGQEAGGRVNLNNPLGNPSGTAPQVR
jgi:hypothetical protein